jgi:GNAT superfamily N-acetyltransferase
MLSLEPLVADQLDTFRDFLGRDDFGGCFCAVWTAFGDDWVPRCRDSAQPNFHETKRRVLEGQHVGFLVLDETEPVAWTGSGPKSGFPLLATKLASRLTGVTGDVWSVACIAIRADRRGSGLSRRIVELLIDRARDAGATAMEAYPTRPWDEPRSYRGSETTFEKFGFQVEGSERDGESEILLMRLEL